MQAQTILLFRHQSPPTATPQPIGYPNLFLISYYQYLCSKTFLKARPSEASRGPFVPVHAKENVCLEAKIGTPGELSHFDNFWHICRKFVWPTEATNYVFLVSPTYEDDTNPKLENPVKHFTGCHLGHKDEIICTMLTDHTCFGYCALFDTHFFATFSTTTTFMVD